MTALGVLSRRAYLKFFALVESLPSRYEGELRPLKEDLFASLPRGADIVELGPGPGTNDQWIRDAQPSAEIKFEFLSSAT